MPILRREGARLLSMVGGRPHATSDDHYDPILSRPAMGNRSVEVDIHAEPVSSDDEVPPLPPSPRGKSFVQARKFEARSTPQAVSFKRPQAIGSPGSAGSKRSFDEGPQSSDPDGMLFSSQGSSKKQKSFKTTTNIHASAGYGKHARARTQRAQDFKKPRQLKSESTKPADAPKPKGFVQPKGQLGSKQEGPRWRPPAGTGDTSINDSRLSSPASSLSPLPSSPDVEQVRAFNLPPPKPYASTIECTICGQTVNRFLKEDFEDQFTPGKQLSYKWQQRFCIYHKQQEAKAVWIERGYPEIDWGELEERMWRRHARLLAVIDGTSHSYHRDQLHKQLKERMKTSVQILSAENVKRGAVVGYYGPRGEKLMTDHIVAYLSEPLRKQSTKDRHVAAAGISGGVSGFVQAVLVPELAQQLVMEDMDVREERARGIITESAELGDLLHLEAEERVTEVVDLE